MIHRLTSSEAQARSKAVDDPSPRADGSMDDWASGVVERPTIPLAMELSDPERLELIELRREVKALRLEREMLRKAAAFFAAQARPSDKASE